MTFCVQHAWRVVASGLVGLLLSACVLINPALLPHEKPKGYMLSAQAKMLPVPVVHQKQASLCGLVAMEMVAQYYHTPLKATDIAHLTLATQTEHGLSGAELEAAFRNAGFFAVIYPGRLDQSTAGLYTQVDAGRPVIVMIRNPKSAYAHYLVVSGYDPVKHLVIFVDPTNGVLASPVASFEQSWDSMGRFSLLAVPRGPRTGAMASSGESS